MAVDATRRTKFAFAKVKHTFQIFAFGKRDDGADFAPIDENALKAESALVLFIGICVTRFLLRFRTIFSSFAVIYSRWIGKEVL